MQIDTQEPMTAEQQAMIEEFQCPGCTLGGNVECGAFKFQDFPAVGCNCVAHSAGTFMSGVGKIALGLPKGFNRVGTIQTGFEHDDDDTRRSTNIRLVVDSEKKEKYDDLNVPVWAMEHEGHLFIRVMCPRINYNYVDVVKGGNIEEICPQAIDISKFVDEID